MYDNGTTSGRIPWLLDLGCKAGGASMGYHRAGFIVVGVDIEPQPRYPFAFHQANMLDFPFNGFDVIHASPPCHDHTPLTAVAGTDGTGWILTAIRDRLTASGIPWVIENVPGAPMRPDVTYCGHPFGLRTRRHRQFELSPDFLFVQPPAHFHRDVKTATKQRRRRWDEGWDVSVTGDVGVYVGPQALGIDWMNGDELSNAIPPAYTEHLGRQLLDHLRS